MQTNGGFCVGLQNTVGGGGLKKHRDSRPNHTCYVKPELFNKDRRSLIKYYFTVAMCQDFFLGGVMVSKIRKEDLLLFCCCLFSCSQPTLLHSHRSIHIHTYPYPISPKSLLLRSPPIFPSKLNAPRSLPSPIITMKLHVIPACKWVEHLVVH